MIDLHIQTKLEDNEVKVAELLDVEETTSNREIIVLLQNLRHVIKFLEDGLYLEWGEKYNKK